MTDFKLSADELKADPETIFTMMDKLGEGSYGAVYKAMHKKSSTVLALKIVPVDNDLDDILKEISVMTGCNSSAIVQFYGNYIKNDHLWMAIEYCAGGSVSDVMKLTKTKMSESEIAVILKKALAGLAFLHKERKIHRDIKAGNILLNHKGEAKLADFGVAGQLSDTVAKRNTVIGTPYWMAPEIIQEVGYGVAADIWSLGITCIEMAEGRPPHYNIHPMRAIFIIPSKPSPTLENAGKFSKAFNEFIAKCLTKAADKRPSAEELLLDPFVTSAPNHSILLDKVQKTMELIASGALEDDSDEEEDGGAKQATARPGKPSVSSMTAKDMKTMTESFGTMITAGTMVVNESNQSTMLVDSGTMVQTNAATFKPVDGKQPFAITAEGLNDLLKMLETNMEKEILSIKGKYERKRKPILDAIRSKKGGTIKA